MSSVGLLLSRSSPFSRAVFFRLVQHHLNCIVIKHVFCEPNFVGRRTIVFRVVAPRRNMKSSRHVMMKSDDGGELMDGVNRNYHDENYGLCVCNCPIGPVESL